MKAGSITVAVLMLAGLLGGGGISRAQQAEPQEQALQGSDAPASVGGQDSGAPNATPQLPAVVDSHEADICEVPAYLLTSESSLSNVAAAIKDRHQLDILVVGSGSSALTGPEGARASYPARLEVALRERLTGITVNVSTDLQVKKTAADVAEGLEKLAKDRKPTLVIWQTGTVDALRSIDPDDFRGAIDDGISALQAAGADVLLMNLQYSPRMETMIAVAPYLDNMRVGAQEYNVPLFDRFAMMRHWNESGHFDLFNPSHGFGVAKRVHECLGQALATFVIDAAHVNTAELRMQR